MSESTENPTPTNQDTGDTVLLPGKTVVLSDNPDNLDTMLGIENLFNVIFGSASVESLVEPPTGRPSSEERTVTAANGHVCVASLRHPYDDPTQPSEADLMWSRIISKTPGLGF